MDQVCTSWPHNKVPQASEAVHSINQLESGGCKIGGRNAKYLSSQLAEKESRVLPQWSFAARIRAMPDDSFADREAYQKHAALLASGIPSTSTLMVQVLPRRSMENGSAWNGPAESLKNVPILKR